MSEDSFSGLVDVSLILGVVANAAWFVLRYLYYEFIRATSPNGPDRSALQDALQGVPIREEN